MKKPASGDNAKPIQPSVEPKNIDIQPKIEINVKKEIAEEIISKPQENIAEVNHGVEEREEEEEETRNNEEEAPNNKDEEDLNQCEENEEEKIEQERVFKDKWRQDYSSYQEVKWKVSEEGKLSNQKGLVFKGNEEKEEEIGEFEYEESEEKQEDLQEENDLEENENVIIQEESYEEEEEENDEIENNDDVGLGMPQMMNQEVLTKKLEKCIKKREKTLDLIKKITSNSYIKAIGDHMFAEIVNFFKLKLEVSFQNLKS